MTNEGEFPKMELSADMAEDLLDDAQVIDRQPWRHGTRETMVFSCDGHHWRVTIDVHTSEGWQVVYPLTAYRVIARDKIVKEWVRG